MAQGEVAARGTAVQSHGYSKVSSGGVVSAVPVGGFVLFECGASFLRDYAGSGLCGGVGASELFDC